MAQSHCVRQAGWSSLYSNLFRQANFWQRREKTWVILDSHAGARQFYAVANERSAKGRVCRTGHLDEPIGRKDDAAPIIVAAREFDHKGIALRAQI